MHPYDYEDPYNPTEECIRAAFEYAVGQSALDYLETCRDRKFTLLAEQKAVRTLARIYEILRDDELEDPECFMKIDQIIMLFSQSYQLSTSRHLELD